MTKTIDFRDCCVSLTAEAMIRTGEQIEAERSAWRSILGVRQGLEIPEKPLPATEEERLAELAVVTRKLAQVIEARLASPPGPNCESLGHHMLALQHRWIALKSIRQA